MSQTLLQKLMAPVVSVWTDVRNVWTKHQGFPQATLTYSSTIAWDGETQQNAKITLTGSPTLGAISNCVAGHYYTLLIVQDATGGRSLDLSNSIYQWVNGSTPTIGTAANQKSLLTGYFDGTKLLSSLSKF